VCATQYALRAQKFSTAAAIWLGARLSGWPDRIISDSMASAQVHRERLRFSGARWEVIPNGFDLDQFRPCDKARGEIRSEFSIPDEALLVGLIGRYHPVKDHTCFLEAAAFLRRKRPEARFMLVGPEVGDNSFLRERAATLGLADTVHLVDEREDIPRITAALDIAISSSYSESFPNVVGEAMSCGVPCVVTDVGDSALLVADTGLVVPARDPAALAGACNDLAARGRKGRQALGRLARQRIAERFSINAVAPLYEKIYEQTLAPRMAQWAVDQPRFRVE
jgi:glycosyltransferase involved in cell wall biosynthesis